MFLSTSMKSVLLTLSEQCLDKQRYLLSLLDTSNVGGSRLELLNPEGADLQSAAIATMRASQHIYNISAATTSVLLRSILFCVFHNSIYYAIVESFLCIKPKISLTILNNLFFWLTSMFRKNCI